MNSTEGSLVRVKNYIIILTDYGKSVLLILLGMPVPFDTINQNVLFL